MALIKINTQSLVDSAITTAKIADKGVTMDKTHMDARGGAVMFTYDSTVASGTNDGWKTLASITLPNAATISDWNDLMSVTFFGYISSGAYYWTWRIYDNTDSDVVMPVGISKDYRWNGNSDGTGGGFQYQGAVHSHSQQSARVFDVSGRDGNTLQLQLHGSSQPGDTINTSSQTLYADQIFWYGGAMTGMHNETGY